MNEIIAAEITGPTTIRYSYIGPVVQTQMTASDYHSLPSVAEGISTLQIDARTVEIDFDNTTETDTSVEWSGTTPGILTPQTFIY